MNDNPTVAATGSATLKPQSKGGPTMADIAYDGGLTCSLQCSDLDAAIKWYQDTLGFDTIYKMDDMGWAELSSSVDRVNVGLSQVEKPQCEGGATLTFGVKDVAAARKEVEAKGVKFDGDTMTIPGMVSLATFFDPDGNKLMFYQDLQGD